MFAGFERAIIHERVKAGIARAHAHRKRLVIQAPCYYSSTIPLGWAGLLEAARAASLYLPRVAVYLDDIGDEYCSPWTGELLAVNEFNDGPSVRKIAPFPMLIARLVFKNAKWIDQVFIAHIHDHDQRSSRYRRPGQRIVRNEYIEAHRSSERLSARLRVE